MAAAGRLPDGRTLGVRPTETSLPRLATGCRWAPNQEGTEGTVLFPEGAIKVEGTGKAILEQCSGEATFAEIVEALIRQFTNADPARIREDVGAFLEALQQKRIVDY